MKNWSFIILIILVSCSEHNKEINPSSEQVVEINRDESTATALNQKVPDNFDIVCFQKSFDLDSLLNSEDIILDTLNHYFIKLDYENKLCGRNIHVIEDSYFHSSMAIFFPEFVSGANIRFCPDFKNLKLEMNYSGDTDSIQNDVLTISPIVHYRAEDYYDPVSAEYTGKKEITWFIKAYRN